MSFLLLLQQGRVSVAISVLSVLTCGSLSTVQGIMGCQHWHASLGSVAMELRWPAAMAGKETAREYVKVIVCKN